MNKFSGYCNCSSHYFAIGNMAEFIQSAFTERYRGEYL